MTAVHPVITSDVVTKLLAVVDAGLVIGLGKPTPGQMCVEAAVCYALGLPHGDDPQCVAPSLRSLKIRLNDSRWSSKTARAKGLRRLAVIQLGSKNNLDAKEFAARCSMLATRTCVPIALRAAASINKDALHKQALLDAANRCEIEGSVEAAKEARKVALNAAAIAAVYAAAYAIEGAAVDVAPHAAARAVAVASADVDVDVIRDKMLSDFAEGVVQILIEMKVPGCEWLPLTELESAS